MEIRNDDLNSHEVSQLLLEHLQSMRRISPPESVHALDVDGLRKPDVTFWTVWDNGELLGCGALKELGHDHGEVKSMRTASRHLRKGVGRHLLEYILHEARQRGYRRLSLETGSQKEFQPAHKLYASCGFTSCGPFGDYVDDPNSVFMTKEL